MILMLMLFILQIQDTVFVRTPIFDVWYSQTLEQPLRLIYRSTNRPKNVDRGTLDFHAEPGVKTSNAADYNNNEWDKGHLAPAATFSDTRSNLEQTFTYLNSALQQQDLNRGEWRKLEEQERKWDDKEPLTVEVIMSFSNKSTRLSTGATIPDGFHKHILFEQSGVMVCYYFPNVKPTKQWPQYQEADCNH